MQLMPLEHTSETSRATASPTNIVSAINALMVPDFNGNTRDTFNETHAPTMQIDVQLKLENSRLIQAAVKEDA